MEVKEYKCPACNNITHNIFPIKGIIAVYCPFCQNKLFVGEE